MSIKPLLLILICILLASPVLAQKGHMTLLAVSETPTGFVGGTADLYLEIKPGTGRMFLSTFPFTKVDTQMSARFAKEIACDYVDNDCDHYDFFYTIESSSAIVAGPSAGAAISVLTAALLEGRHIDEKVSISGTINSGGVIGPVGGLKEKIGAGAELGLKKILIPKGEAITNRSSNETLDIEELSKRLDIEIAEVASIDDAYLGFTGISKQTNKEVIIDTGYTSTMEFLTSKLCERTYQLQEVFHSIVKSNDTREALAQNLTKRAGSSREQNKLYSAASFCYGANIEYSRLILEEKGVTNTSKQVMLSKLKKDMIKLHTDAENYQISTITDIQAYMIVKERLSEATEYVNAVQNATNEQIIINNLALAQERINSAFSWATFFGNPGRAYSFNNQTLKTTCITKLSEVEERLQYINEVFPLPLQNLRQDYLEAKREESLGNYELCIFKASKAKANIGMIISVFGVRQDDVGEILQTKLDIVEQLLAKEAETSSFPIVGYSYFEYANSLKENDPFSALLYAEYALELGNLDIYFDQKENGLPFKILPVYLDRQMLIMLALGISLGILVTLVVLKHKYSQKKKKRKKKKPRHPKRREWILSG